MAAHWSHLRSQLERAAKNWYYVSLKVLLEASGSVARVQDLNADYR